VRRKPGKPKRRRRFKTRCRVPGCALCAQEKKHRRRERAALGPGAKVTLAHLVRGLKALGAIPGVKVLKNGDILLPTEHKDRLDRALFTPARGQKRPGVNKRPKS